MKNNLIPILCVGETLEENQSGKKEEILKNQIIQSLNNILPSTFRSLFVAYEPVWAIGTGLAENPEQAQKTIEFILSQIKSLLPGIEITMIYGGSVDAQNIESFINKKIIQGALVGGASLKKEEFAKILEIANSINPK